MNIYQKLAKIREMVNVIQKNKAGYGYKYVTEDEILAKVTVGMKKFSVSLIPMIKNGTSQIIPYKYVDKKGKDAYEIIVSADMVFRWVNDEDPSEYINVEWVTVGSQSDPAQAMGAGLTYTQRYFMMKYFQMATVDDDPDEWRGKQREAEALGEKQELESIQKKILILAKEKIEAGVAKDDVYQAIADNNDGRKNPNSVKTMETAKIIFETIEKMKEKTNE